MAGVADTVGSARVLTLKVGKGFLRSAVDILDIFELEAGMVGLLSSGPVPCCGAAALFEEGAGVEEVAEVKGAAKVFFTLEKIEETMAYEELSCSSSSANGLYEVRLVTSSSFELLRDLVEAVLPSGGLGVKDFGESIITGPVIISRELRS